MPRSQMHPDEFPMCSRWVFWRNRPAALGCPAGRRVKIRRRERHRELLTRSYNFPDVGSLFGHRINILRWPAGHRQEADRPSVTSYGVRIDIGLTEPTPNICGTRPIIGRWSADARPMICRRLADDLPAPGRFPADYLASDATLWHIGQPPAGGRPKAGRTPAWCRRDVGYNQCDVTPTIGLYYEVRT